MTDAVIAAADWLAQQHGVQHIDVLGVSLSSEFVTRAQTERPELFRRLALVSPTGFSRAKRRHGPPRLHTGGAVAVALPEKAGLG
jgi:pimeloyl-ACP methyl ester carboxylesterase